MRRPRLPWRRREGLDEAVPTTVPLVDSAPAGRWWRRRRPRSEPVAPPVSAVPSSAEVILTEPIRPDATVAAGLPGVPGWADDPAMLLRVGAIPREAIDPVSALRGGAAEEAATDDLEEETPGRTRRWRIRRARTVSLLVRPGARFRWIRTLLRRLRRPLLIGGVLATVAAVGYGVWVVAATPTLGLRRVEVRGTSAIAIDEVVEAVALKVDTPLVRISTSAVAQRVAALPAVASVDVRRSLLHTLVVTVTERVPVVAVPVDAAGRPNPEGRAALYRLVDADGVGFRTIPAKELTVPVAHLAQPGPSDPATRAVLAVWADLPAQMRQELESVKASGPGDVMFRLRSGTTVVWGEADDAARKLRLARILLEQRPHRIDLTVPDVVTVR